MARLSPPPPPPQTEPSSSSLPQPPSQRKLSLHYILSSTEMARDAPDVPGVTSPRGVTGTPVCPRSPPSRPGLATLPPDVLGQIAYYVVVHDPRLNNTALQNPPPHVPRPSRLLPLLLTNRALKSALEFDANPVLYNRLFRATFDLGALVRRTQWMFDVNTDVPGTSRKTELFANPRSWAMEYRDRWELRNRVRACIAHQSVNVPGISNSEHRDTDMWALWFLWTENDEKNIIFLTEECHFHEWIMCYYKDDMLKDSLKSGYPEDSAAKALGIWTALLSGGDLLGERSPAQIDDKIFMLRPYVFSPQYQFMYAPWEHKRLPLCKPGCNDHPVIQGYAAPYKRFGHKHMRAPPHFVLGAYLVFVRLLERQPTRVGLKFDSTVFQETGQGLFSLTHIMSSLYHDTEWQRNTVCQDPHTSPGLPPLTYLGRLQGFWRGKLLFFDFEAYRNMLAGNARQMYTATFAQHAVELEIQETVIRVRLEDVGGKGALLNCGFADDEVEEEQERIKSGYGHQVLTGDDVYAREQPGWTKEILLSGGCRSAWGWSRVRGRVRAWDGLITLSIGESRPYPAGQWVWRGYLQTGGYLVGRWRDCFTPADQKGYEGPVSLLRAGDLFYPPHFPTSMASSAGVSTLDFEPDSNVVPGPAPGGLQVEEEDRRHRRRQQEQQALQQQRQGRRPNSSSSVHTSQSRSSHASSSRGYSNGHVVSHHGSHGSHESNGSRAQRASGSSSSYTPRTLAGEYWTASPRVSSPSARSVASDSEQLDGYSRGTSHSGSTPAAVHTPASASSAAAAAAAKRKASDDDYRDRERDRRRREYDYD